MSFPSTAPHSLLRYKHTCSLCARRKVKCNKGEPCSNCLKAKAQCLYEAPAPPRPRKRAADEELLARLALYEELMRKHDIDFAQSTNTLGPSRSEVKAKEQAQDSHVSVSRIPATGGSVWNACPSDDTTIRCLWSDLSSEVCSSHDPCASYGCSHCCSRLPICFITTSTTGTPHGSFCCLKLLPVLLNTSPSAAQQFSIYCPILISLLLSTSLTTTQHSSLCYWRLTSLP